ncbi:uncharacterized protein LOC142627263 [Castanea sativa]|uniref:uncharacterized protein LOC142627263 n=1 Tax=Castanea sativa TaxID=21020 RepID=UPI003F64E73B
MMRNNMTTLTRGVVRNLLTTTTKSKTPSSFYNRSISFTSSSTLTTTTTTTAAAATPSDVVSDAVPDVADVEEDVVFSDTDKTAAEPTLLQPRVLVYDGVCHLCHGGVKWVIQADKYKKIKYCCVQSKAAEPYLRLCGLEREDVLRRFLFIEGPGLYHQASTAALKVMSYLPLPYSALSTLLVVPTPLRDSVYDYIAKRRYNWFGKSEDCLVLKEKELLERFIDREEMMDRN